MIKFYCNISALNKYVSIKNVRKKICSSFISACCSSLNKQVSTIKTGD